jgi:PTK7 protein tyrosine kinase 7
MRRNLLVIEESSPEDNGVYRCLARNNAGASSMARSLALIVPSNETATVKLVPQSAIARRGESASFSCVYDNADSLSWYYEDKGPIESDDERTILGNGTLLIHRADERSKGFYSCHGEKSGNVQVYAAELEIACEPYETFNSLTRLRIADFSVLWLCRGAVDRLVDRLIGRLVGRLVDR